MFELENNLDFLIKSDFTKGNNFLPFDKKIVEFVDDFSKLLLKLNTKSLKDLKSLSFWCRKSNLEIQKKKISKNDRILPKGIIFHITPSNVPTNFAYSLIFGLLTGNINIVKVPSKNFEQIEIICKTLNILLKKYKYNFLKNNICILRYDLNNKITEYFSKNSQVRLIWGGEKTILEIKKIPSDQRTIDILFSDRFSFSVIDLKKLDKISNTEFSLLVKNFYNDTYLVDQNGCSSPKLVIWLNYSSKMKKKFWDELNKLTLREYNSSKNISIEKKTKLLKDMILMNEFKSYKIFSKNLYVIRIKKITKKIKKNSFKFGYFYEYQAKSLEEIEKIIDKDTQTLSYFGINKINLFDLIMKKKLNGVDRIVPIGQTLNIDMFWDGYDLNSSLTRIIK